MLKNKTKLIVLLFTIITFITTFSFAANETEEGIPEEYHRSSETTATDENTPNTDTSNETAPISEEGGANDETNTSSIQSDIHQSDLYLFDSDVTMDKLVNGNVYIFGNNVKITGQIAGNLYVCGNNVTVEDAYIQSSAYIVAQKITFGGIASDLYATCNSLEIPSDCGVYRDLRVGCNTAYITGIIGKDAFISTEALSLEKDGNIATIYGNLNYSSNSEINIPSGSVEGKVNYSKSVQNEISISKKITNYLFEAACAIVFTLVIYLIALWLAPKTIESIKDTLSKHWLPSFGIGLLALILIPIISIILMISIIGVPLAFVLLVLYGLLLSISISVLSISLTKIIANKFNINKKLMNVLILILVSLVIWALKLIPFVGPIVYFILLLAGFGSIIMSTIFKNNKNINLDKNNSK